MYFKFSLLICFTCLLQVQCIDEIKLNLDKATPSLIVDGLITDSLSAQTIRVHRSAIIGVGNDNILEPVSGAIVSIIELGGNRYTFVESKPGIYTSMLKAVAGKNYAVEIKLPDGQLVKSDPQELHVAPPIGEISTEVKDVPYINTAGNVTVDTRLILKMNTDLTNYNGDVFIRWLVDGEFEFVENYPMALSTKVCYVKNNVDLNNLKIFDSRILSGRKIVNEPFINTALDYRFATQYCFHIQQMAMSEAEFQYWSGVQAVTNIDGSLFDAPPGTVKGNLYFENNPNQKVVGYFSVNGLQATRIVASPQSLDRNYIEPKCRVRFNTTPSPDCKNCLLQDGSSTSKPSYWKP